jgi:hypothetical protein
MTAPPYCLVVPPPVLPPSKAREFHEFQDRVLVPLLRNNGLAVVTAPLQAAEGAVSAGSLAMDADLVVAFALGEYTAEHHVARPEIRRRVWAFDSVIAARQSLEAPLLILTESSTIDTPFVEVPGTVLLQYYPRTDPALLQPFIKEVLWVHNSRWREQPDLHLIADLDAVPPDVVVELMAALDEMHRALGGGGLAIRDASTGSVATAGVGV